MSFLEPFGDKPAIIIDIGHAYTKCGYSAEPAPHAIIPTQVSQKKIFDYKNFSNSSDTLKEMLIEFFYKIYYKILNTNSKERKVVIVESVLTPSEFRTILADVLFNNFQASSVLFMPSHMASTYTLGINRALVIDIGYADCQIMPVSDGYSLTNLCNFVSLGAKEIHSHLKDMIEEYAFVTIGNEKVKFSSLANKPNLTESILEDIKLKCCFVTSFDRAQRFNDEIKLKNLQELEFVTDCDFNLENLILQIPGYVREMAFEILFRNEIDKEQTIPHLILETLSKCPIDLKKDFASNIVLIGGGCMLTGFKNRLVKEINCLLNSPHEKYSKIFSFNNLNYHTPPSHENYTAWLGASLFGSLEILDNYSLHNGKYKELDRLPDWFSINLKSNMVQI
ncbi:unnamed protein product [Brachionus calyciflorus]|uniref:Uncharacterized protein n=1 Tax=Brachionus calyciflorus TaxID=104777 RepID=A0A813MBQ9_9BILA|nr:unnamed protein product [Brachionus calyciflorus]